MPMYKKLTSFLLVLCLLIGMLCGCGDTTQPTEPSGAEQTTTAPPSENVEAIDYAGSLTLDMDSETAKAEVTVKQFIDGDTTHFYVDTSVISRGLLKARYLAVNTPESTGVIEEYGKKASNFTKEKLSGAEAIIVESDTAAWETDSTGDRHLSWVWYKPAGSDSYRNLNIELLQNGLAIASNSANNRYGETAMQALEQAKALKLNVHSGQKDPDFYYGEAVELTLKELRTNIENYHNMRVAFNGVVTVNSNNTAYVEAYDAETDMYYGMAVYYGYNLTGKGLEILQVGNEVRIVGSVQYYEAGGTWQVADLKYRMMAPDDPNNIQKLSSGNDGSFVLTDPAMFNEGTVTVEVMPLLDEEVYVPKTFDYSQLAMNTTVRMENLTVVGVYTTTNEDSASKGAMTLTCQAGDQYVAVRTVVLRDADGNLITGDAYQGKTINVNGIVDYFSGDYQIKVFSADDIEIVG